jgi:hypothetical protein
VLRARVLSGFHAALLGVIALVASPGAPHADPLATVFDVPLPGGLPGALAAINDRVSPDRSQFLLELIRRLYDTPISTVNDPRAPVIRSLVDRLNAAGRDGGSETVPLPLAPSIWIDTVFKGRSTTPQTLVSAIVQSRGASLLYYGLLSLDDDTRAWMATQPDLITDVVTRYSAAFLMVSPVLRVRNGAVQMPGGEDAAPIWRGLTDHAANDPRSFVRALLAQDQGRLAYFFRAMAQMTPIHVRLAFNLDSPDANARVTAARRLHTVFERIAAGWYLDERAFWRPEIDPALLMADLRSDAAGRPLIPGSSAFWNAAFEDSVRRREDIRVLAAGDPVGITSLCEQIFAGDRTEQRHRYDAVMFASRVLPQVTPQNAQDAIDAVRGALAYPALIQTLERARLEDVAAFASAARRATELAKIADDWRATRAYAQFQGALVLVTRATMRGSVPAASLPDLVSSLAAVATNERGDYDGGLVRWFDSHLAKASEKAAAAAPAPSDSLVGPYEGASGPIDEDVLVLLAGASGLAPRFIEWEGMRYRLDFRTAEATRLAKHLGDRPRPYLSSAQTLVVAADVLNGQGLTRDALQREAGAVDRIAQAGPWFDADEETSRASSRFRDVTTALQREARDGDLRGAARLVPALREAADDFMARGLLELAYAAALGQPDRTPIDAGDAASRHDFGLRPSNGRRNMPWRFPVAGAEGGRSWHVRGSLLGLDVALAEFALVPLSSRPPTKRPTLNDEDRRIFSETVVMIQPSALDDETGGAIVDAVRNGRARLAAATPADAAALADAIDLSPVRRTLLPWVAAHQPERLAGFLSPSELFWLGLADRPVDGRVNAWGTSASPRVGCLCLQMIDRRPWEDRAGRWHAGLLASGFPDLNLRLAELLADMRMPAALLAPVLAPATLDLVNSATSRDQDDRRGLVDFVQALRPERVEEYLALLTTDGPLVPVGETGKLDGGGAR